MPPPLGRAGSHVLSQTAPAKLNLYVHVLGRRADGRRDLDSLIVFTEIGDRLTMRPAASLSLEVRGAFAGALGVGEDNLVMRAARALQNTAGGSPGAAIVLEKEIPVAAGLGGGSADAAATLRLLARLWEVDDAPAHLAELAAQLGSDVAACLHGQPCYVVGAGDSVEPAPELAHFHTVLVNPGVALATGDVFAAFDEANATASEVARLVAPVRGHEELAEQLRARSNDLEAVGTVLVPEIALALETLAGLSGCLLARMSGSGATCFGLFARAEDAAAGAAVLRQTFEDWWVRETAFVCAGEPSVTAP